MEKIVIEIKTDAWIELNKVWNSFKEPLKSNTHYTIKEVKIEDNFFKDDPVHATYKKEANQAYKKLKEYEFKQRNK